MRARRGAAVREHCAEQVGKLGARSFLFNDVFGTTFFYGVDSRDAGILGFFERYHHFNERPIPVMGHPTNHWKTLLPSHLGCLWTKMCPPFLE